MRTRIINQDRRGRQRKRPTRDLNEEHTSQRDPDREPGFGRWGRGRRGHEGEVGHEDIGDGEAHQEDAPRFHGSESRVRDGVDEELHRDADDAENGHGETDGGGLHADAAGEAEWEALEGRERGVVDWC